MSNLIIVPATCCSRTFNCCFFFLFFDYLLFVFCYSFFLFVISVFLFNRYFFIYYFILLNILSFSFIYLDVYYFIRLLLHVLSWSMIKYDYRYSMSMHSLCITLSTFCIRFYNREPIITVIQTLSQYGLKISFLLYFFPRFYCDLVKSIVIKL